MNYTASIEHQTPVTPSIPIVQADPLVIRQHIEWLHQLAEGLDGDLVLTAMEQEPKGEKHTRNHRFPVGDMAAMTETALAEARKPWTNLYFACSVVRSGLRGNARGKAQDVLAVLMLGVDQDADTGKHGRLPPLEPNLLVQTSQIPALNHQAFYVFDPQDRPIPEQAHSLGTDLRKFTGADSRTGDIAGIYRLPGSLNWPTPEKLERNPPRPAEPQLALIEKQNPGHAPWLKLRSILERPKPNGKAEAHKADEAHGERALMDRASRQLKKALKEPGSNRSNQAYRAIMLAMNEGFSDSEIQSLLDSFANGCRQHYTGPKHLADDIARIRLKWRDDKDSIEQALIEAKKAGLPEGFALGRETGELLRLDPEKKTTFRKVCSRIKVPAKIRDKENSGWGVLVQILDPDSQEKEIIIPWGDLGAASGALDAVNVLRREGLQIAPGAHAKQDLRDFLTASNPSPHARRIDRTGWQVGPVFALPGPIIGAPNETMVWAGELSDAAKAYAQGGSLELWREKVAQPCAAHPMLIAAFCQALVSPLLDLFYANGFGIHFFGPSSTGKTTALVIAASVWGPPQHFLRKWRATDNGLEAIADAHNEVMLVLDEVGMAEPEVIDDCLYMLAEGKGKQRSDKGIRVRALKTWTLAYLSTGEKSMRHYVNSIPNYGKGPSNRATAGQSVRCLDIRVPADSGIFRKGSRADENAKLAKTLKAEASQYHGTAGRAFIEGLIAARNADTLKDRLSVLRTQFEAEPYISDLLNSPLLDGQVSRVIDQIFILYAAGCLAGEMKVFPFTEAQVREAAVLLLVLWIAQRGGIGAQEEYDALEAVRAFLLKHQNQFIRTEMREEKEFKITPGPQYPVGYYLPDKGIYAVFHHDWKSGACFGLDEKQVARQLGALGYMNPGKDRTEKRMWTVDGHIRLVAISEKIFTDKSKPQVAITEFIKKEQD